MKTRIQIISRSAPANERVGALRRSRHRAHETVLTAAASSLRAREGVDALVGPDDLFVPFLPLMISVGVPGSAALVA